MSSAGAAIHKARWLLPRVLSMFAFFVVIFLMELSAGMVALMSSAGSRQLAACYCTEYTAGQEQHPA